MDSENRKSKPVSTGDQVTNLVTALEQGQLSAEELAQLDRMIVESDEVLRAYVAHVQDSVQIHRHAKLGSDVLFASPAQGAAETQTQLPAREDRGGYWRVVLGCLAACAACVVLTWCVSQPSTKPINAVLTPARVEEEPPTPRVIQDIYVATLTGTVDCQWTQGSEVPAYGEPLEAGHLLKLEAGVAQVTFNDGAKVVLQGPAEFEMISPGSARLASGKLSALVPMQAVGFRVHTPSAEVVDLGTEFGLVVSDDGHTEVHVFAGEVVVWDPTREEGETEGRHLSENQAVVIGKDAGMQRTMKMDASKFRREITPRLSKAELPPLGVTDYLALWLAADVTVKTDDSGGVIAWRDIAAGDNQSEEDAWQQEIENRPRWVRNGISGLPSIRFDGKSSYLTTTPLLSTESQTLFLVFSRRDVPMSEYAKRQILNYNGPPHALSPFDGTPMRVLQIDDLFHKGIYRARFYAGGFSVGGASSIKPVPPDTPTLLAYRYDTEVNESMLAIDGEIREVNTAPRWKSYTSRKVFGRHPKQDSEMSFFAGDIAEVLIYNGALDEEQMGDVTEYLMQKYSLK
ncbi:FecR domain-containing protein [Aeoliella sp. ICT_H6.2]|uniref:FecR domain-containing protein n=1 Tax=Aeoliella straminimaris TaxID=2954799 RepID=A0A9X2FEZ0_9BACT|nr:FecR domain-containing protein [Aeoliella straminimaris]MCO6047469.1 FecR domain-containing protein [Aeoliella straminimaris]